MFAEPPPPSYAGTETDGGRRQVEARLVDAKRLERVAASDLCAPEMLLCVPPARTRGLSPSTRALSPSTRAP
jgi:hypothetical protein